MQWKEYRTWREKTNVWIAILPPSTSLTLDKTREIFSLLTEGGGVGWIPLCWRAAFARHESLFLLTLFPLRLHLEVSNLLGSLPLRIWASLSYKLWLEVVHVLIKMQMNSLHSCSSCFPVLSFISFLSLESRTIKKPKPFHLAFQGDGVLYQDSRLALQHPSVWGHGWEAGSSSP